jgi:hypothetical protein
MKYRYPETGEEKSSKSNRSGGIKEFIDAGRDAKVLIK